MKVRVSTIPANGLEINTTLPLEALNARMNEGRDNDIVFTAAPKVSLLVSRNPSGAECKGTVSAPYTQPCGRCDKVLPQDIEVPVNLYFSHVPDDEDASGRPYEDDIGISYFEGDHIELEGVLQEALILSLSKFFQPPIDEVTGKCTRCGLEAISPKETKEGIKTSLGDLLKKAGLN